MKLHFYDRGSLPGIPFLDFEGEQEVATVDIAANYQRQGIQPRYLGREALIRVVDLRRVKIEGYGKFPGYTDRGIIPRLEGIFTEAGRQRVALHRLASIAYHERRNHEDTPELQRLSLIEDQAEVAIGALRHLANANPAHVQEVWPVSKGFAPVGFAGDLVEAIDEAYRNPVTVE